MARERRLLEAALAPFFATGAPFPADEAACPVCRDLEARLLSSPAGPPAGPPAAVRAWVEAGGALWIHRNLHRLVRGSPPRDPEARRAYLHPAFGREEGRPVLREPEGYGGYTERSKAFFLLHRHRFGRFVRATMRDFELLRRGPAPSPGPLRLYDADGRALELSGCTAGYDGGGPHGTVWVLRRAGFPDDPAGLSAGCGLIGLERLVFGYRAFRLHAGGAWWAPQRPQQREVG
jgi:hypothetical protein